MRKIRMVEELREIIKRGAGYIVITDKPTTSARVHSADCPHIIVANFEKKVVQNREKNGSYFWVESLELAKSDFEAEPCLVCKR